MARLPSLLVPPPSGRNVRFREEAKNDIEVNCVPVPWRMFMDEVTKRYIVYDPDTESTRAELATRARLRSPHMQHYVMNVLSDARLGSLGLNPSKDTANTEAVQEYARAKMRSLRSELGATMHASADGSTRWVIEFVVNDKFARYCLVPEHTISPLDRVKKAIAHVETHMTATSMVDSRRPGARDEDVDAAAAAAEEGSESFVVGEDVDVYPERGDLTAARSWWLTRLHAVKRALENAVVSPTKRQRDSSASSSASAR